MTTVLDCIMRIPEKLSLMQEQGEERFAAFSAYVKGKQFKELVFIASGSSYNSAFTARSFLERLGFRVRFVYPNMFVHYHEELSKQDTLYIVISQGGSTKLVYEALQLIKEKGGYVCSITAELAAPIAREAGAAIAMGCDHEEFMYRTLGYSTTVASCWQLGLVLAEEQGMVTKEQKSKYEAMLSQTIAHLPKLWELILQWYEQHRFSLMHKAHMMFAGTNDLWPVCMEADIKVMEMVPLITRSFELEEFIHGPQNAFDDTSAYFLFARKGEDEEKVRSIARFLKKEIGFCCVVGNMGEDRRDFFFEEANSLFSALEYATFAQIIAYKLADDHGRDLSRPVNGSIKNYVTKTL